VISSDQQYAGVWFRIVTSFVDVEFFCDATTECWRRDSTGRERIRRSPSADGNHKSDECNIIRTTLVSGGYAIEEVPQAEEVRVSNHIDRQKFFDVAARLCESLG
jgi:hypothetical protein